MSKDLLTLSGHANPVYSAEFSPDGQSIVTASGDNTAKVWDARTDEEMATLVGHATTVFSAVFSPDGRSIVTASKDGILKTFKTAPWRIEDLRAETKSAAEPDGGWGSLDEEWQTRFKVWKRQR